MVLTANDVFRVKIARSTDLLQRTLSHQAQTWSDIAQAVEDLSQAIRRFEVRVGTLVCVCVCVFVCVLCARARARVCFRVVWSLSASRGAR